MKLYKCSIGWNVCYYVVAGSFEEAKDKAERQHNEKSVDGSVLDADGSLKNFEYQEVKTVELITSDFKI